MRRLYKIIVVSDSHGYSSSLDSIISKHKDADIIIHCGDSNGELEEMQKKYKDKMYYAVKGNCDLGSKLPTKIVEKIGKYTFFITHGHLYNAKWTLNELIAAAKKENADFLLYGHTHTPLTEYYEGMYIINPGSSFGYGATYALIEIMEEGVLTNIGKL